jgi:hypothetical protein
MHISAQKHPEASEEAILYWCRPHGFNTGARSFEVKLVTSLTVETGLCTHTLCTHTARLGALNVRNDTAADDDYDANLVPWGSSTDTTASAAVSCQCVQPHPRT